MTAVEGLLPIDKPQGITSHDAVAAVRRALGTRKVGHAGTLDPMATGLLLVGVGRATRLLRFLGELSKVYQGTFRLGVRTDTLDAEGEVVGRAPTTSVTDAAVRAAMQALTGDRLQRPPAFSAVKVGGRKLYEAARHGEALEAAPRVVSVRRFEAVAIELPDVEFVAEVGAGTYVRVLAAEAGESLGCGAHLTRLRRTAIGSFRVEDARPPDEPGRPLALETAVAHLPRVELDAEEAAAAGHGRILAPAAIDGPYGVFGPDRSLIGVWMDDGPKARPQVVLSRSE